MRWLSLFRQNQNSQNFIIYRMSHGVYLKILSRFMAFKIDQNLSPQNFILFSILFVTV